MIKSGIIFFTFIAGMSFQYYGMKDYFSYAEFIVNQIDDCEAYNGRKCDYIVAPVYSVDLEKNDFRPIS